MVFAVVVLWPSSSWAMELLRADVKHDAGHYTVGFEVLLDVDMDEVRRVITDYNNLPKLSERIIGSRVLSTQGKQTRLELILRDCVSVFCKTLRRVEDIKILAGGDVVTRVLPEMSDFLYAWEHWQIQGEEKRTRIKYHSELALNFFVPPVVGPAMIRSKMREEVESVAGKLEKLAGT